MTLRESQTVELKVDVDDQKGAETLLAGENRLLEMIAKGRFTLVDPRWSVSACRRDFQWLSGYDSIVGWRQALARRGAKPA